MTGTGYHISWSRPVAPQKGSINPHINQVARRGEALGTASLHRIINRAPRTELPVWLNETLRVSQRIILVGHVEVLLISAYFYAGRTTEIKTKSDLLLAEIYQHCASTNLLFIIAADFNNPVVDFPAYRAFKAIRCQEAFELARLKFAKELPPTCRNTTRNDSHRPLFVQFRFTGTRSWCMTCGWGDLPLDPTIFEHHYHLET